MLATANIDVDTLLTTHIDSPLALLNNSEGVQLKLGPWRCDKCGEVINEPKDGMLQWLARVDGDRQRGRDLGIVHHMTASPLGAPNGCYPDQQQERASDGSMLADDHLDRMLGWDGLVILLAMIEDGTFSANEVNRIIMRLFVPGYEEARPYFQKALDTGIVQQGLPDNYFMQTDLQDIVANISRLEE